MGLSHIWEAQPTRITLGLRWTLLAVPSWALLNLSEPRFSHLKVGASNTFLVGLDTGLKIKYASVGLGGMQQTMGFVIIMDK